MVFEFFEKIAFENKNADFTDTFYYIFQEYHKALKEIYRKKEMTFEKASKLELALYLLFRADFILQKSSKPNIRQLFLEKSLKRIQGDMPDELLDLCYLRLEIYGKIYNDFENKQGNIFSIEFLNFSYDWLISAIELCKDDYKLMAKEKYIPLSLSITSNYPIKVCLQELDIKYTKKFIESINNIIKQS
ncbi:MAG: hypothetical protein KJ757_05135 [Planctomycetes bacterium]|nr:hypothetical protein [Planctomycetota bacterium]MBU1518920.1 hypothetical protein [Planctomycetota bacterium]MBU2457529.1 hypothetical protein [Planctomycetota bacterium]MBU2596925.1 hypothetical protein [Planctomycetota bacterium]